MGLIQSDKEDYNEKAESMISLLKLVQAYMAHSSERVETYIELIRDEFIPFETYEKMLDNEMLGLIKDIEDTLLYYKAQS